MTPLSRRDLLTAMLQALFLALFPWLRTERGLKVAEKAAERYLFQLDSVDVLDGTRVRGVEQVETIGMEPGEMQTYMVIQDVRFHVELEPAPLWRFDASKKISWKVRRS